MKDSRISLEWPHQDKSAASMNALRRFRVVVPPPATFLWSSVARSFAGLLAFAVLISCQSPTATKPAEANSSSFGARTGVPPSDEPVRDLRRDEAAGGHILRKHVGQTEEQLRQRLEREPNITGASTYTDRSTAERVVGAAIAQSQGEIERWLARSGRHPNLVLDYDSPLPIGRTMNRGEYQSRVCAHALIILRYNGPNDFYVLTSYPECRT